ncbi:MAG: GNAT family N-acetyltransferase [Robiginitomaculum sp.]|nr:GNAT family N-acetyltransferase [Robiginitomaculum sp.]
MRRTFRVDNADDLSSATWDDLHGLRANQEAYKSGFLDPDFARLIAKVRRDVSITFAEDKSGLLAYWPMHIGMGKWARAVGFPFADQNGPIVRSGETIDIPEYLHCSNIAGFKTSGLILEDQARISPIIIEHTNVTNLEMGLGPFIEEQTSLYPKFFKKIARLGRKLEKEHSEAVFTFDDKCGETFHQLIAMKREQYARTKLHDVLRPIWVNKMLDMLRHGECENINTILSTLRVDGRLVAAEFNMQSGDLLHGWLTAYNPKFSKYSPGLLLTQHIIKAMPQYGFTLYDSGSGNSHYKKYFTNQLTPLGKGPIFAKTKVINPIGIMGASWSFIEANSPSSIANNMGRIRRRSDQIIGTETMFKQRVRGFSKAALPFL